MPHDNSLIATIVAGLGLAFVFGSLAFRLRVSPLVGYLVAGVLVGPLTPGFTADQHMADELAEIGIILLMFGVGLHFSLKDLLAVRAIALPGAVGQMVMATLLGMGLGLLEHWSVGASFLFGLALSVASTVVLLRALQERRMLESERGKIAIGWLIVEDLAMVLALVLAPAIARLLDASFEEGAIGASPMGMTPILTTIGFTLLKVAAFVALMLVVGRRAIPWILHSVAHTGSRELFRLAVLAIALCTAYGASTLFGVSFALGAFFAGMMLSESQLSQRAAQETLPLRDAFAVLFFVSVGMLFNPHVLIDHPLPLLATIAIITIGKAASAFMIVRGFRYPLATALTISASLAQIGEFSFILAGLGVSLGLMRPEARDLILAGAIISIVVNPLLFKALDLIQPRLERMERPEHGAPQTAADAPPSAADEPLPMTHLAGHAVLVGYGRVGGLVGEALRAASRPTFVIEDNRERVDALHGEGIEAIAGNAADPRVLAAANLGAARTIYVAIPDAFEAGQIVEQARQANPALAILARASTDAEVAHLTRLGADLVVMGEREIARGMIAYQPPSPGEPDAASPADPIGEIEQPERGQEASSGA
jgi:monovalent cation:H+ antiporter-2, CPA2 family